MLQAFVFERVAVLVGPWHEPVDPPERGTRVEVRLLDLEPRRGSWSAAQRVVIDDPVFRADLFDAGDTAAIARDATALHDAVPAIVAAVNATWDAVRAPAP